MELQKKAYDRWTDDGDQASVVQTKKVTCENIRRLFIHLQTNLPNLSLSLDCGGNADNIMLKEPFRSMASSSWD